VPHPPNLKRNALIDMACNRMMNEMFHEVVRLAQEKKRLNASTSAIFNLAC